MRWTTRFTQLAYLLVAIGAMGLIVAAIEGTRAAYIKIYTEVPRLPSEPEPTKEQLSAHRKLSYEVKWSKYIQARDHSNYGLLVALICLTIGVSLGITTEKMTDRQGSSTH